MWYNIKVRNDPLAQAVEHLTFNQGVRGSIPRWVTSTQNRGFLSPRDFWFLLPSEASREKSDDSGNKRKSDAADAELSEGSKTSVGSQDQTVGGIDAHSGKTFRKSGEDLGQTREERSDEASGSSFCNGHGIFDRQSVFAGIIIIHRRTNDKGSGRQTGDYIAVTGSNLNYRNTVGSFDMLLIITVFGSAKNVISRKIPVIGRNSGQSFKRIGFLIVIFIEIIITLIVIHEIIVKYNDITDMKRNSAVFNRSIGIVYYHCRAYDAESRNDKDHGNKCRKKLFHR